MTGPAGAAPVQLWTRGGYELAEGLLWVSGRLVFVDILTGRLLESAGDQPGEAKVLAELDVPLGAVAPVADRPGEWIAAAGTGIALLGRDGGLSWIDRPEDGAAVAMRMNDGCCDPAGRFWAGSMAVDVLAGAGSLYRVGPGGTVRKVLDGMTIVNGPAFTADGSLMYVADTFAGVIYLCRIDPATGDVTSKQIFAEIPPSEGAPDGMTVDDAGCLWVALWDGAAVRRYRSDGSVEANITVPAPRPTSVCLGGANGDRLFVTTARYGVSDPSAESGAILSAQVRATALPVATFAGLS
ncbi:MAG: SMP-30/gluconolactonase/LRE family protein [Actinobacteria bacterium]|nr:SMP-30/gluconolactonase/LRE family protein [Actinomycetota bacterium]